MTEKAEELWDKAAGLFARNDYAKAESLYSQMLSLEPDYAQGYSMRCICYQSLKEPKKALPDIEKAISLLPKNGRYYCQRAGVYIALGENEKAKADVEKAVELDPDEAGQFYFKFGSDMEELAGNKKEATVYYKKSVDHGDFHDIAKNKLAEMGIQYTPGSGGSASSSSSSSSGSYATSNSLVDDGDDYYNFANASGSSEEDYKQALHYDSQGKLNEALVSYTKTLEKTELSMSIQKEHSYRLIRRGIVYFKLQQYDNACRDLDSAIHYACEGFSNKTKPFEELKRQTQAVTYNYLGCAYHARGENWKNSAIECWKKSADLSGKDALINLANNGVQYTPQKSTPTPRAQRTSSGGSWSNANSKKPKNIVFKRKNQGVLIVLSVLLGYLGVDRFYIGRWGLGILKIITLPFGVGIIWWLVDIVLAITGKMEDSNLYMVDSTKNKAAPWIVLVILLAVMGFGASKIVSAISKPKTAATQTTKSITAEQIAELTNRSGDVIKNGIALNVMESQGGAIQLYRIEGNNGSNGWHFKNVIVP